RFADVGNWNESRDFAGQPVIFPYSSRYLRRRNELGFICGDKVQAQINIQPEPRLFTLELSHRLLEQLAIQIKTNRYDVAALSATQNAAAAPNLQVRHGDAKPRAERAVLFDGADPFARGADCHHFARKKQVGVSLVLGSPNASAQLIQIRQTKLIRAIDNDRVCIWNIETAFDDCSANEHVGLRRNES